MCLAELLLMTGTRPMGALCATVENTMVQDAQASEE